MTKTTESYFRLRAVLIGHEKDVRCLTTGAGLSENLSTSIISGSRDLTIRLWKPNDFDVSFLEQFCAGGHSNFIASVCVVPAGTQGYENGAIVSGSGDGTILVHSLNSPEPAVRIPNAHENTVSALYAGSSGFMVSGSWDMTAKVWMNFKAVMTLKGHEGAVWSVLGIQSSGLIITGSADKTIRIWTAGQCKNVLTGHTDCVRGLAMLPATADCSEITLLSCSNDQTVRRWNLSAGSCMSVYNGHTDFIYSIASGVEPATGRPFFATVGEDRTLRVWNPSDCQAPVQTVAHPAQSVWAVCILSNGDVVSGSSDGQIRVFTVAPERFGSAELQAEFEKSVSKTSVPAQTFGGIKFADLPGPDVLMYQGKRDGQTVMVRFGDDPKSAHVECHMWSAADERWNLVGTVVGSNEGGSGGGGQGTKVTYEGQDYDYVFDVDLDQRTLKLPYNIGENPWTVAHSFLEKNELNPVFVEEVADFIIKNTKSITIGAQDFQGNVDPFTGGSSYHTGGNPPSEPQKNGHETVKYFPEKKYLLFDSTPNLAGLRAKLLEFDGLHSPHSVGSEVLNCLVDSVAALNESPDGMLKEENVQLLGELIFWPDSHLVPILDMIRVVAKNDEVIAQLFRNSRFLPALLKQLMPEKPTTNQFLTLRILCNIFASNSGRLMMLANSNKILPSLEGLIDSNNKNVQIAASTVLLNYAVIGFNEKLAETKLFTGVADVIRFTLERGVGPVDCEAVFRLIIALGTLVSIGQVAITEAVKNCQIALKTVGKDAPKEEIRIRDSSKSLLLLLSAS